MNKILCFDTSSNSCSVAISEGQNILSFEQEMRPSMQAERLMVMIESALSTAKMQYSDIEYLAVTTGPGSFTGIRIALSVAKGILYASPQIKSIGVNNFESALYRLKMQINSYDSAFIILNAYRKQCYVQEFKQNTSISVPRLMDNSDVVDLLASKNVSIACGGSGIAEIYNSIKNIQHLKILPRFPIIKALHIARYADDKINSKKLDPIEPLYIRLPDAIIPRLY